MRRIPARHDEQGVGTLGGHQRDSWSSAGTFSWPWTARHVRQSTNAGDGRVSLGTNRVAWRQAASSRLTDSGGRSAGVAARALRSWRACRSSCDSPLQTPASWPDSTAHFRQPSATSQRRQTPSPFRSGAGRSGRSDQEETRGARAGRQHGCSKLSGIRLLESTAGHQSRVSQVRRVQWMTDAAPTESSPRLAAYRPLASACTTHGGCVGLQPARLCARTVSYAVGERVRAARL